MAPADNWLTIAGLVLFTLRVVVLSSVHLFVEPFPLFRLEIERFFLRPQNFIYQNQPCVEPKILLQAIVSRLDLLESFLVTFQVWMVPLRQLKVARPRLLWCRPVF